MATFGSKLRKSASTDKTVGRRVFAHLITQTCADGAYRASQAINNGENSMTDRAQVGGSHYQTKIQPIDYINENGLSFNEGNVVKYITRHKNKNGEQDVNKVIHYALFVLKYEYGAVTEEQINQVMEVLNS